MVPVESVPVRVRVRLSLFHCFPVFSIASMDTFVDLGMLDTSLVHIEE